MRICLVYEEFKESHQKGYSGYVHAYNPPKDFVFTFCDPDQELRLNICDLRSNFHDIRLNFHNVCLSSKMANISITAGGYSLSNSFSKLNLHPACNKAFSNIKGIKVVVHHFLKLKRSSVNIILLTQGFVKVIIFTSIVILLSLQPASAKCTGRFVNPITDVCWECIFPISIGNAKLFSSGNPDTDNPSLPVCACGTPIPRIGIAAGFWEPVRLVDVTKRPFCFPNLGGIEFNPGIDVGVGTAPKSSSNNAASWHVHWYVYPLIYWLELLLDLACLEQTSFDLAYITELDPMWQDDALTFILNPEAILFGNPVAQAACAADCVASSTAGPLDALFWCAGCQGSMYPLSGKVGAHITSVQSSLLAVEKFTYKLHRELIEWGTSGPDALCHKYPMPVMKKSQYRAQLTVPVPSSCYPYGKSSTFYESGKEIPIVGEDFGYLIWRKRNCCVL